MLRFVLLILILPWLAWAQVPPADLSEEITETPEPGAAQPAPAPAPVSKPSARPAPTTPAAPAPDPAQAPGPAPALAPEPAPLPKPAEPSVPTLEAAPAPKTATRPPPLKTKAAKRPKRKLEIKPAFKRSISPKSFVWIRALQSNLNVGSMANKFGVVLPGQFYILSTHTFTSSATSDANHELNSFTSSTYLFSPQYSNWGLVGHYANASSANSTFVRAGVYNRITGSISSQHTFLLLPIYMLADSGHRSSRALLMGSLGLFNRAAMVEFTVSQTSNDGAITMAYEGVLGVPFYDGFSGILNYTATKPPSGSTRDSHSLGLEYRAYF